MKRQPPLPRLPGSYPQPERRAPLRGNPRQEPRSAAARYRRRRLTWALAAVTAVVLLFLATTLFKRASSAAGAPLLTETNLIALGIRTPAGTDPRAVNVNEAFVKISENERVAYYQLVRRSFDDENPHDVREQ